MNLLRWLKKLCNNPQLDADACFNDAQALLDAGNYSDALLRFSRVLQFVPDHAQALARRERLVIDLGLDDLDRAARLLERFAYSHCGAGYGWKVEMREAYAFSPHQPPETYDAAFLDLCQTPPAFIELTVQGNQYKLRFMVDTPVPGVSRTCLSEVNPQSIPANADALLELLDQFVKTGLLVKVGKRLRYAGKKE